MRQTAVAFAQHVFMTKMVMFVCIYSDIRLAQVFLSVHVGHEGLHEGSTHEIKASMLKSLAPDDPAVWLLAFHDSRLPTPTFFRNVVYFRQTS